MKKIFLMFLVYSILFGCNDNNDEGVKVVAYKTVSKAYYEVVETYGEFNYQINIDIKEYCLARDIKEILLNDITTNFIILDENTIIVYTNIYPITKVSIKYLI